MNRSLCFIIILLSILISNGCSKKNTPPVPAKDKLLPISVQLDWFPEPEHGGLYQALAKNYFTDEGLAVTLISGGNNILVTQMLASGRAQIGQSDSTKIILAAARGLPVKIIGAVFHNSPSGLMLHADNPISRFEELDGKTIMARTEALYIPYIKKKYGITFNVIPQNFGLGQFMSDKNFIQEGFYIAEFYFIEKEGVKPKVLNLWDSGYMNSLVLAANTEFIESHSVAVDQFMHAFIKGWSEYLEGDSIPAREAMKEANRKISRVVEDDFLDFSRKIIIRDNLARGNKLWGENYGILSIERVEEQISQLIDLEVLKEGEITAADVHAQSVTREN
jgi:NitT/TauT family transport system substrate-binding protein